MIRRPTLSRLGLYSTITLIGVSILALSSQSFAIPPKPGFNSRLNEVADTPNLPEENLKAWEKQLHDEAEENIQSLDSDLEPLDEEDLEDEDPQMLLPEDEDLEPEIDDDVFSTPDLQKTPAFIAWTKRDLSAQELDLNERTLTHIQLKEKAAALTQEVYTLRSQPARGHAEQRGQASQAAIARKREASLPFQPSQLDKELLTHLLEGAEAKKIEKWTSSENMIVGLPAAGEEIATLDLPLPAEDPNPELDTLETEPVPERAAPIPLEGSDPNLLPSIQGDETIEEDPPLLAFHEPTDEQDSSLLSQRVSPDAPGSPKYNFYSGESQTQGAFDDDNSDEEKDQETFIPTRQPRQQTVPAPTEQPVQYTPEPEPQPIQLDYEYIKERGGKGSIILPTEAEFKEEVQQKGDPLNLFPPEREQPAPEPEEPADVPLLPEGGFQQPQAAEKATKEQSQEDQSPEEQPAKEESARKQKWEKKTPSQPATGVTSPLPQTEKATTPGTASDATPADAQSDSGKATPTKAPSPSSGGQSGETPVSEEARKEEAEEGEAPTYFVKFNNVTMSEYIRYVSMFTGKNFIFDPEDLDFKVTIVSNEPTTVQNIMAATLQMLRIRGLSMSEMGNNIIIFREVGINSPATVVGSGKEPPKDTDIITQVYSLTNADPATLANIIRPMLSESAIVEAVPQSRHLIVTGLTANVNRITKLIENIDSPETSLEVGEYTARAITISQAIEVAEELLLPIVGDRPFVITSLPAKNTAYVVSTPIIVAQALALLKQIDVGTDIPDLENLTEEERRRREQERLESLERSQRLDQASGKWKPESVLGTVRGTKFYLHKLQYRKGDQIQQALQAVAQSLQQVQIEEEEVDLIATINSVQWIESSNSLVFTGTPGTLQLVKELVDEIDTALPQVLIEVLILEATLDDTLTFGVDWGTRFGGPDAAGAQAFLATNSPLNQALDSTVPTNFGPDASGLARAAGFNLGVIGRTVTKSGCNFGSVAALVSALNAESRIDILLNPKIVVEDNATAEFFVGINTAFQTQSIANDFGTTISSNFEFKDVGSTIKVTPLVGNNGIITLDIEQEVSSAAGGTFPTGGGGTTVTTGGGGGQSDTATGGSSTTGAQSIGPTTRKSTTKTRIHMPDGYFLIMSGQIRDEREEIRNQVPCLGGIPFLGGFFSQKRTRIDKKNLMLFIRPQIVDVERINPITKRQQDIWKHRKRHKKRWQFEVDEALDFFNIREPYGKSEERPLRN